MKPEAIIETINSLPIAHSERMKPATDAKISATAEALAPILSEKRLRIVKGGSSPSTTRSYARIYLEPITNTTHDSRHAAYTVIAVWEWQTASKYGFTPISQTRIRNLCDTLLKFAQAA